MPAFLAPLDYAVDGSPWEVRAGDFNGDDVNDIATLNAFGGRVSVLLSNGDGTFQSARTSDAGPPPSDLTVGPYPQSVAVGDFDADGNLDLAASTYDYYGDDDDDVLILLGHGDGTFAPAIPQSISYGSSCYVGVGKLNADDKLDLVVTSTNLSGFGGSTVSVLLGRGDGTFQLGATYGPSSGIYVDLYEPVLADFNFDGKADVAIPAGTSQTGLVKVYVGNGDGTLQQPRNAVAYTDTYHAGVDSVAVGDFNADGLLDLATANFNGSASVLLGKGDGTFQPAQSIAAGVDPASPVAGDVDADGRLDLVVTSAGDLLVLLGNGDGGFALPIATPAGSYVATVVLADFDADGLADAAAGTYSSTVSVLLNDSVSSLPPPSVSVRDATVIEGNSGTLNAAFTVTLSHASTVDVTVRFDTADMSALSGSDYMAASGSVLIPAGQTTATFTVKIIGDRVVEPTETFAVNLSNPTNATISGSQGLCSILDNEPRISIDDVTKAEGKRNKTTLFTFNVTLLNPYDQPVTMSFASVNGTATTSDGDYVAKSGTLTFAPGQTTKTIAIEVKGDSKQEASETFFVDLFGLGSNAVFTKNRGSGTIVNDD